MNSKQAQQDVRVYLNPYQFGVSHDHWRNTNKLKMRSLSDLNATNSLDSVPKDESPKDLEELQGKLQSVVNRLCLGDKPYSVPSNTRTECHLPLYIYTSSPQGTRGAVLFELSTDVKERFSLIVIDPTLSQWESRSARLNTVPLKVCSNLKQAYYYVNEISHKSAQFRQLENHGNCTSVWYYRDRADVSHTLSDLLADEVIVKLPNEAPKNPHLYNPSIPQVTKEFDYRKAFLENNGCPLEFQSDQLGKWKSLTVAYFTLLQNFYTRYSNEIEISDALQMIDFSQTIHYLKCLGLISSTADAHWMYLNLVSDSANLQQYPISFVLPRSWMQKLRNCDHSTSKNNTSTSNDSSSNGSSGMTDTIEHSSNPTKKLYEKDDFRQFVQAIF